MNRKQWQMVEELRQENKKLKEELSEFRADWSEAPSWASKFITDTYFLDGTGQAGVMVRNEERRPEVANAKT